MISSIEFTIQSSCLQKFPHEARGSVPPFSKKKKKVPSRVPLFPFYISTIYYMGHGPLLACKQVTHSSPDTFVLGFLTLVLGPRSIVDGLTVGLLLRRRGSDQPSHSGSAAAAPAPRRDGHRGESSSPFPFGFPARALCSLSMLRGKNPRGIDEGGRQGREIERGR